MRHQSLNVKFMVQLNILQSADGKYTPGVIARNEQGEQIVFPADIEIRPV